MTTVFERWALVGAALVLATGGCGSDGPDQSVKDGAFCEDFQKQCPDEDLAYNSCRANCRNGIAPTTEDDFQKVCWETYCAREIGDCNAASLVFTIDPDVKDCARAHGWLKE